MKILSRSALVSALAMSVWMLASPSALAQTTLTFAGEFTQNSINTATGSDPTTLGYSYDGSDFFGPSVSSTGGAYNDLTSLPSFVSVGAFVSGTFTTSYSAAGVNPTFATPTTGANAPNANNRYQGGYSSITINGTAYHSGVDYKNNGASTSSASPTALGAIQLTSGVPSSFNVGFLLDNTGTNQGQFDQDVSLTLEDSTGAALSTLNLESSLTGGAADNFYYATVSNATAGDYLVLNAYNVYGSVPPTTKTDVTVGGIVFSAALTPEPSTWALLGFSLIGGLVLLIKRRSSASKG